MGAAEPVLVPARLPASHATLAQPLSLSGPIVYEPGLPSESQEGKGTRGYSASLCASPYIWDFFFYYDRLIFTPALKVYVFPIKKMRSNERN